MSGLLRTCLMPFRSCRPQLCGIFEADVSTAAYTPRSANAARGVTEMRPLRGQDGKETVRNLSIRI